MTFPTPPHYLHSYPSPLGPLWLSATDRGLSGLWFDPQKHLPDFQHSQRWQPGEHRFMQVAMAQLGRYFDGQMSLATRCRLT
jgi:methylated-DNA-[protein]-cysteine S-methyltransferase